LVEGNGIFAADGAGSGFGIYLDATGATCRNIAIRNNLIVDAEVGIRENVNNTDNLVVESNTVLDTTGQALQIKSDGAVVRNNTVNSANSSVSFVNNGDSSGQVIVGNVFDQDDGTTAIDLNNLGSTNTVRDNLGRRANDEVATGTTDISPKVAVTRLDSSGGAVTATLGSAFNVGQMKTIVMTDASNSSTVSVTNHATSDPEVFTFAQVDDTLVLMWVGTEWVTIANSGVAT